MGRSGARSGKCVCLCSTAGQWGGEGEERIGG